MVAENAHPWLARLRARAGLVDTVSRLARAVGEVAGAQTVGVFLLDYTGQDLLFYASWSEEGGEQQQQRQALPLNMLHDPLCFSLQNGKLYTATVQAGLPPYPSLALLPARAVAVRSVVASPLLTRGDTGIGGILLAYTRSTPVLDAATGMLIDFGALLLDTIIRQQRDHALLNCLREDIDRLDTQKRTRETAVSTLIIGDSRAIRHVREKIAKAAPHDVPVLITGETGTGKELAASAIHAASPRTGAPFVKINCGALPAPLLESELFGHKKGSFSGAASDHIGLLRSAAGGTVLLDEIGEMPLELQVKLLRVLQDHHVRPVGHTRSYPVDIRILSATNAGIEQAIAAGAFRRDLYHRLRGFHIHMPPLRERVEDIPVLTAYYLEKIAVRYNRKKITCDPETMRRFLSDTYPGNVRQLFAELEQAALVAGEKTDILTEEFFAQRPTMIDCTNKTLKEHLTSYEDLLIDSVVSNYRGNITKAAEALGVPRTTLSTKLQKKQRHEPLPPPRPIPLARNDSSRP
jgi:transcriptional regulator with GAF, ATPase, and Fis domain